jgi:hypothetical protein
VVARVVRDFGGFRVTTVDWPLALMEIPEHRVSDADLEGALAYFEQVMLECRKTRERFSLVTDLGRLHHLPPASQRKIAGEWLQRTAEVQKATSVGGANVTPSAIIRGIVTAIYWFQTPVVPTMFFATRNEATLQAIRWLEEAGVPLSSNACHVRDKLLAQADREKRNAALGRRR